jgi:hypothetical protein
MGLLLAEAGAPAGERRPPLLSRLLERGDGGCELGWACVPETAVSRSCACIGSPCLRHCVHGASIGDRGAAHREGGETMRARTHAPGMARRRMAWRGSRVPITTGAGGDHGVGKI